MLLNSTIFKDQCHSVSVPVTQENVNWYVVVFLWSAKIEFLGNWNRVWSALIWNKIYNFVDPNFVWYYLHHWVHVPGCVQNKVKVSSSDDYLSIGVSARKRNPPFQQKYSLRSLNSITVTSITYDSHLSSTNQISNSL